MVIQCPWLSRLKLSNLTTLPKIFTNVIPKEWTHIYSQACVSITSRYHADMRERLTTIPKGAKEVNNSVNKLILKTNTNKIIYNQTSNRSNVRKFIHYNSSRVISTVSSWRFWHSLYSLGRDSQEKKRLENFLKNLFMRFRRIEKLSSWYMSQNQISVSRRFLWWITPQQVPLVNSSSSLLWEGA